MPFEVLPPPPSHPPVDSELVDRIVSKLKSQGIFDDFRKDCLADVDTKPAYQNLQQRVNNTVANFLSTQVWQEDLNKTQLRESLRKHVQEGFLEVGVDRIVDQVVNPKILPVFMPKVEDVVYECLGLEKPKRLPPPFMFGHFFTAPPPPLPKPKVEVSPRPKVLQNINVVDLLPKDLDPVSPGSDIVSEGTPTRDERDERNNNESLMEDSQLSGISELSSHVGDSIRDIPMDSNTTKSISSNKAYVPDLQFDNFSNLSEKIKQAERTHGQVTDPYVDAKVENADPHSLPVSINASSPKETKHGDSVNEEMKLEVLSNTSMSTFDDSKTFPSNKFLNDESHTFSEDSFASSTLNIKDQVMNNTMKPCINSENSSIPVAEENKHLKNPENPSENESTKAEIVSSPKVDVPMSKSESKGSEEIKDVKHSNKDKKDQDNVSSSKNSKNSGDKHRHSDSKHRATKDLKDENSHKNDSKSSKGSHRDGKERSSKDDHSKSKHKDDRSHSSKDKNHDKDRSSDKKKYEEKSSKDHDKDRSGDKKKCDEKSSKDHDKDRSSDKKKQEEKINKVESRSDSKEHSDKDKKSGKDQSSKENSSKTKEKEKDSKSKHDRDKDRHSNDRRDREKSDKDRKDKDKSNKEKETHTREKEKHDKDKSDREKSRNDKERNDKFNHDKKGDRDKSRNDKERNEKINHDKEKVSRHNKDKEIVKQDEKEMNKEKTSDDKKKEHRRHDKSSHPSSVKKDDKTDDKKSKSSGSSSSRNRHDSEKTKKEDERKDRKRKGERCNEEVKTKEARRSSDRDSNGGKGGSSHRTDASESRHTTSRESNNTSKKQKTSKSSGNVNSSVKEFQSSEGSREPTEIEKIITKLHMSLEEYSSFDGGTKQDDTPVKKPKIANSVFELRKIMQARKNIDKKSKNDMTKNWKEDSHIANKTHELQEDTLPPSGSSSIPEENKENIKTIELDKLQLAKNGNMVNKFYGFHPSDVDISHNKFIKFCDITHDYLDESSSSALVRNTSCSKYDKGEFEDNNSAGENEVLLDDNLNSLKPKLDSFEKRSVNTVRAQIKDDRITFSNSVTEEEALTDDPTTCGKSKETYRSQHPNKLISKTDQLKTAYKTEKNNKKTDSESVGCSRKLKVVKEDGVDNKTVEKYNTLDDDRSHLDCSPQSSFIQPPDFESPVRKMLAPYLSGSNRATSMPITEDMLDNLMKETTVSIGNDNGYESSDSEENTRSVEVLTNSPNNERLSTPSPEKVKAGTERVEVKASSSSSTNSPTAKPVNRCSSSALTPAKRIGTQQEGSGEKIRRKQRLSRSSQRYESTDLYKPRPVLPQNSKRVRASRSALRGDTADSGNDQSDSPTKKRAR